MVQKIIGKIEFYFRVSNEGGTISVKNTHIDLVENTIEIKTDLSPVGSNQIDDANDYFLDKDWPIIQIDFSNEKFSEKLLKVVPIENLIGRNVIIEFQYMDTKHVFKGGMKKNRYGDFSLVNNTSPISKVI
ncbi:MAG: hypothetical protein COC24_018495 [Alphaproteobacteria bacterium]|nr:hypothetical protein [Alphaproteobacteria bacterium]